MSAAARSVVVAVAFQTTLALASCARPQPRIPRPNAPALDAARATDATTDATIRAPEVYVPPRAPGPTGTIEGSVSLDGEVRRGPAIVPGPTWQGHPGCREAAMRYAAPFDISTAGPFPGALVAAEALESELPTPRDRRIEFHECDITPRFIVAHVRDRIFFHTSARTPLLPSIVGGGQVIDQLLIPGSGDQERHVRGPGRYPIAVRTLPEWVQTVLLVMANRYFDQTNDQGHFRITDVPVGNVTVHAWYPGTLEQRVVVAVRANETATADFHLRQAPPPPPMRDAGNAEVPP